MSRLLRGGASREDPRRDRATAPDPHERIRDPHDRARTLAALRPTESLRPEDDAWLESHLADCEACAAIDGAYRADRVLLRGLRERSPEPPRDLWARTSIAVEREARRPPTGWRATSFRRAPISMRIASGLLVVALAVTSLVINGIGQLPGPGMGSPGPSGPAATPITVAADVGWLRPAADGSYEVFLTHVGQVCPEADPSGCDPIQDVARTSIALGALPESVSYSAAASQLVVVSSDAATGGSVIVVAVPTAPSATPSVAPTGNPGVSPTASIPVTVVPSGSPAPSGSALVPTATPGTPIASPGASAAPGDAIAIAENVIVVGGSAAYSADGSWLAFAARPADGSAGPDIYVWRAGDPTARVVTSDHRSVFSAWLGNRLLGMRVEDGAAPTESRAPDASPDGSGDPGVPSLSGVAFLLDPATGRVADLDGIRYVRPVVDPTGQWVVYWEGTLTPVANGLDWRPGSGRIVVAPWNLGDGTTLFPAQPDPAQSPEAGTTTTPVPTSTADVPESTAGLTAPGRSGDAGGNAGPRGNGTDASPRPVADQDPGAIQILVDGPLDDFDARFDPTGTHLAVWVGRGASAVGLLSLFVLDDGRWTPGQERGPTGMPALRGFSIGDGQLAWVAPAATAGTARRVQVLGWTADGIGSVVSAPGDSLIVIR